MKTQTVLESGLVKLQQTSKNRFTVVYFKQVKKGLTYSQAARELGCCLMHQAACDGLLDNSGAD